MMGKPGLDDRRFNELIDALVERGWYVGEQFIEPELCRDLNRELDILAERDALAAAGIGRGQVHEHRRDIRGDTIHWLDRESEAQGRYLDAMAGLQHDINRVLFLGLFEYEAHFARYAPGAFYKRHLDSFRGRANRVLSTVCYLNADWPADGGGEMVLFDPEAADKELARVRPEAGTFACFLSETIPHEVLPTRRPRASIAGWFRRNASLDGLVDPAR